VGRAPSILNFEHLNINEFRYRIRYYKRCAREDAQTRLAEILSRSTEYAATGGPFPDRLPIVAITGKLLMDQYESVVRWAQWAEEAIGAWSGVTPETGATVPPHAFTSGWPSKD
jgi:PadR family transcriptional regulator AphA